MPNKYQQIVKRLGLEPVDEPVRLSEKALLDFERTLGHPLPIDYREFLSRYGFVHGAGVAFPEYGQPAKPCGGVEVFLGVKSDDGYDIMDTKEGLSGRLPDNLLPIADSPGGQICLALMGIDTGTIFWWGLECIGGANTQPVRIADDFDSFMNSLYLDEN